MTEVAKMYGGSLYDLAAEEGKTDAILTQLDALSALLAENPDYLRLLATPCIPKKERCALLDEALGGQFDPYLINFVKILCENGTLRELKGCGREFRNRYNADNGITEAVAWTAVPLDDAQKAALAARLEATSGKKVFLETRIDPQVLGGIRLEMDGVQMDGTLEGRLSGIRKALANTVL